MGLKKLLAQSIIWRCFYFFSVLLVNVFLSRYIKAAGSGNLYYITLLFSFAQTVLSLSAESGIIYFASGKVIKRNSFISLTGLWSFISGCIVIGLVYIYSLADNSFDKNLIWPYCMYGFFYVCGQTLTNYCLGLYYTKDNYFLPNFLLGLVNLVFVILIPAKNAKDNFFQFQSIIYLYFATFFAGGILVYISYILKYKKDSSFSFPNKNQFKQLLKFSATALAANIVFFLVYKIDYVFVNYSKACTAADLGNYIQVSKLGQMFLVIPQIIASVIFPQTATGVERMRINHAIIVMARLLSQIFLAAFIVVALFGNKIFTTVFGSTFNKMQLPMLIIIPGIFSLSVLALLSAYFSGKGKLKVNLYGAILGVIVMIAGDYFFVLPYGIIAAAIISTLSYCTNLGYALMQFYKDYSISWMEFIKWKKSDYNFLFSLLKKNLGF